MSSAPVQEGPRCESSGALGTPWYRQFWPWFLIALPAVSVVFSFATLYIAVSGADEVLPHEGQFNSFTAPEPTGKDSARGLRDASLESHCRVDGKGNVNEESGCTPASSAEPAGEP